MARAIAAKAGMSENQAARLTFALKSAGAEGEADLFAESYKEGVVQDPERLLRGSTALRRAYGNRMSNEQVLDIAMKASEGSPSQATALLSASAGSAAFARMAGVDEKQLLTANAINASIMDTSGGAEKGGTGVNSLLKGLSRLNVPLQIGPGGVATDDEGHVIDASVAKLREYVGAAVKQAGPNLMAQLKAIKARQSR